MNITKEAADIMKIRVNALANNKNHIGGFNNIKSHKYNAKKINGYDSKLESYMASLLRLHKINNKEKNKFLLKESFIYMSKNIRAINIIPDFEIYNILNIRIAIIDTKGFETTDWKIKMKLLKYDLKKYHGEIPIYTPHSQKECRETINKILNLLDK